MKLYLSSFRIGDQAAELVRLCTGHAQIAVITNAMDMLSDQELRQTKTDFEIAALKALNINSSELDLRNYFGKPDELKARMADYDGVWIRGGNTFILRRAMAYSGFDLYIKKKAADPNFFYGGYSAGVCVLSPDLRGLELVDPANEIPADYDPEIIWEGLNLLDFRFAPHYRSDHPETELIEKSIAYFEAQNLPYKALRDGQVLIGDSNKLSAIILKY